MEKVPDHLSNLGMALLLLLKLIIAVSGYYNNIELLRLILE